MTPRRFVLVALPICAATALGVASCPSGGPGGALVAQQLVTAPGFVESHTPGSGVAGVEMPVSPAVQAIVGASPNLNQVSYLRTYLKGAPAPRAILILVPGFLGGGGSFSPLAKQLVAKFNGNLEVWAIDRRPNQLEDRRGSLYAQQLLANATTPEQVADALYQGVFFYFPESDGVDTNQNGDVDPPTELPDALGNQSSYVQLAQDDMRFAAYWGLDTYLRDWRTLVDAARAVVGPAGLVLFGGHSLGTYYASVYAAYDFDPDPKVVDAGYRSIDGILLLEGGGAGGPSATAPDLATYQSTVASLATAGGPDVFLENSPILQGIVPSVLGPGAEMAGLAGIQQPLESSILHRTNLFLNPPFSLLFSAPTTNRGAVGLFIDDDFEPIAAFRASVGFSDDGRNVYVKASMPTFPVPFYVATANSDLRQWKDFDDPTLPSCPPDILNVSPGCAIVDNGPKAAPTETPRRWGVEREVTSLDDILTIQFSDMNFIEWYYLAGRTNLDSSYGRDSSALVAQSVAATGSEGPLVLTQNGHVDVPVLCLGGSNGLAPDERNFAPYLASIATPAADEEVHIIEGYAHLDMITAKKNDAVPLITDWVNRLIVRKLLGP